MDDLAGVGAGGQQRMVAKLAGVAVGGATLGVAVDVAHVESMSTVIGAWPGPAPAAHPRVRSVSAAWSSWRTCPKVNERRNVPSVEGAMTRWPSTWLVAPVRSRSASSIQSPPASRLCSNVSTLRPGRYAPGRWPRSTS
jgi:hypothetical protein